MDVYRCPFCRSALPADVALPHECFGRPLLQRRSVLSFARQDHYWNQVPRKRMPLLHADARAKGCHAALETHLLPLTDDYTLTYAWDERRADWFPLCSLPEQPTVVDVGAGWGAVTSALARLGGRVFALDSNIETLEFVAIRAHESKLANITCVHTDPLELAPLPFADDVADLVVLNGVLEWVGPATEMGDPRDLQVNALREARRVLRPGGTLYLGIESRFGLGFWLGKLDHPATRFTSLLPRFAASWITRRNGRGNYRTYTHGHGSLRRMLGEAGFACAEFYAPFPDYRTPERIVPIDRARVLRRTAGSTGISRRHICALAAGSFLRLHRDLVDSYSVVARK